MTGRTVALYPGAFRPPHVNHLAVVEELADRADEVVVIVSNRGRWVPGWDALLPPACGVAAWELMLGDRFPTVSVRAAAASAVAEAIAMVHDSTPDHHYVLCVGQKDRGRGLGRFAKMGADLPPGVSAEVAAGAAPVAHCSASDLRRALGLGDRARFAVGYPGRHDHLAEQVWDLCHSQATSPEASARAAVFAALRLDDRATLRALAPRRRGPVRTFSLEASSSQRASSQASVGGSVDRGGGRHLIVRCTNDVVSGRESAGHAQRDSVWVERNALQWAKKASRRASVEVPLVHHFDRSRATLALTEPLPTAASLADADLTLQQWSQVAHRLGAFVAHLQAPGVRLMRSRQDKDLAAFARRAGALLGDDIANGLVRLEPCFGHLALCARNVRVEFPHLAVIDFERASSIADPLVDLATLESSIRAAVGVRAGAEVRRGLIAGYGIVDPFCPAEVRRLDEMVERLVAAGVAASDGGLDERAQSSPETIRR